MILRAVRELLRAFAMVAAACTAALSLAAQGGRFSDRLDILAHFTPIFLAACLASALVWALTGRYGRTTPMLALIGTLSALTLMAPELSAAARGAGGKVGGETLTILQFNVWGLNRDPAATAKWILEADPDIIVLEEAMRASEPVVQALTERYPSRTTCAEAAPCSTMILAKQKPALRGGLAGGPKTDQLVGAWATFRSAQGPFTVIGVHYTWPIPVGPQRRQSERLARVLNRFPKDRLIVSGDFNSTPWSFAMRRQDRMFGIERRTRALASWPSGYAVEGFGEGRHYAAPFPFLPIDHLYAGKGWRSVSVRRGPRLGSDHYPVIITLAPAT
jgi:endonuclease/exonuclease/phosphatase (EEP) superfamily protein YafD